MQRYQRQVKLNLQFTVYNLVYVLQVAKARDCARMVWQVLDWNTKALELYERIGGKWLKEWLTVRMEKSEIANFASSEL